MVNDYTNLIYCAQAVTREFWSSSSYVVESVCLHVFTCYPFILSFLAPPQLCATTGYYCDVPIPFFFFLSSYFCF